MKKISSTAFAEMAEYIEKTPCGEVYPLSLTQGYQTGDIYCGNGSALFRHCSGFAYIYGRCGEDFLEDIRRMFLSTDSTPERRFILFTADKRVEDFFGKDNGLTFGRRINFAYQQDKYGIPDLPRDIQIKEFDRELLDSVSGRITPRFSWDDPCSFLEKGKGFCVMHEGAAASWAFSAAVSDDEIDIGVETAAGHQHKGFGKIAAQAMIKYALEHGRRPVWACDTANTASQRLAVSIGFAKVSEYTTIRR